MKLKYIDAIKQIQIFIEDHLSEDITMDQLCQEFNINRNNLQAASKAMLGDTIYEYIRKRRLNWGADRLIHSDDSVERIAINLGYCKSNFHVRFKAEYHCTPDQFRQQHRAIPALSIRTV